MAGECAWSRGRKQAPRTAGLFNTRATRPAAARARTGVQHFPPAALAIFDFDGTWDR